MTLLNSNAGLVISAIECRIVDVPQQHGCEACGAFVLHFMEAISVAGSFNIANQRCSLTEPNGFEDYKRQLYDRIIASPQYSVNGVAAACPPTTQGEQPLAQAAAATITRGNTAWTGAGTSKIAATPLEQMKGQKTAVVTQAEKNLWNELSEAYTDKQTGNMTGLAKMAVAWNQRAHSREEAKVTSGSTTCRSMMYCCVEVVAHVTRVHSMDGIGVVWHDMYYMNCR